MPKSKSRAKSKDKSTPRPKSTLKSAAVAASGQVGLVKIHRAAGLSSGQRQFNKLIQQLDQERRRLAEWQEAMGVYRQRHAAEYEPLRRRHDALQTRLVFALDKASGNKKLGKQDRAKIADIICDVAGDLLAERSDDAVKQLYNKHSGGDFDAEVGEQESLFAEMLGQQLGIDVDLDSPEAMAERIVEKFQEEMEREGGHTHKPGWRGKSARVQGRQAEAERQVQDVSRSIREVYRKLASALHPDREPEGAERDRKTALMQRVNVAYGARDLLGLLELQLEVEQLDQASIGTLPDERLQHYNQVLAEQLAELRDEIEAGELAFKVEFDIAPFAVLSPKELTLELDDDLASLQEDIDDLEHDLDSFADTRYLKLWIGDRHDQLSEPDDGDDDDDDEFLRSLDDIFGPRR